MSAGNPSDQGATVPTLAEMSPRGREIVLAYYESGYVAGIARGRAQVEHQLAAEWDQLRREILPRLRASVPFAELCERRGNHDAAERQRQILRDRGVAVA